MEVSRSISLSCLSCLLLVLGCAPSPCGHMPQHRDAFILITRFGRVFRISLEDASRSTVCDSEGGENLVGAVYDAMRHRYYALDTGSPKRGTVAGLISYDPAVDEKKRLFDFSCPFPSTYDGDRLLQMRIAQDCSIIYFPGPDRGIYAWHIAKQEAERIAGKAYRRSMHVFATKRLFIVRSGSRYPYRVYNPETRKVEKVEKGGVPCRYVAIFSDSACPHDAFSIRLGGAEIARYCAPQMVTGAREGPILAALVDHSEIVYAGVKRRTLIGPEFALFLYNADTGRNCMLADICPDQIWVGRESEQSLRGNSKP